MERVSLERCLEHPLEANLSTIGRWFNSSPIRCDVGICKRRMVMDELTKEKWRRLRKHPDDIDLRNELAETVFHVCEIQCNRILKRIGDRRLSFEELMSIAYETLLNHIAVVDIDRASPSTYLSIRINGALLDFLRNCACETTSRLRQQRNRQIEQWSASLDHRPNSEEIAQHFGFGVVQLDVHSIDQEHENEFGDMPLSKALADRSDFDRSLDSDLLKGCNQQERLILIGYYIEGDSMKEVGASLGLSESRVSQVHTALINRLRDRLGVSAPLPIRANNGKRRRAAA